MLSNLTSFCWGHHIGQKRGITFKNDGHQKIDLLFLHITRQTKSVGQVKQAQDQAEYCKKSKRAMGIVIVSPPTGLCQENCPLSYVNLVRATYCTIGSGQYTLISGRPVQTGQVLFEFNTTAQSDNAIDEILPWCEQILSLSHFFERFPE